MKAFLYLIVLIPLACRAEDWPRFLGPDGNGISRETGLNTNWDSKQPKLLWKVDMHDDGFSGPSAANQVVFIIDHMDDQGVVRALNLADGTQRWTYAYPDEHRESYGFARTTPTFDAGRLYVLSRMGEIFCLDAKQGTPVWQKNLVKEFRGSPPRWQISGSPVIDGDSVLACIGGPNTLVALDKANGELLWKGGNGEPLGYATPVLAAPHGKRQVLVMTGKSIMALQPGDGSVLWTYPWPTRYDVNAASPTLVSDTKVFITSGYRHGCALLEITPSGVDLVWENQHVQAHFSTPVFYRGFLYANSDPDHLVCLDPDDGAVKWKQKGFEKGGLIMADGVIFALGGKTGDLVAVKAAPDEYKELGRINPLGGRSWTAPILVDGKLIIRNMEALACLDLR